MDRRALLVEGRNRGFGILPVRDDRAVPFSEAFPGPLPVTLFALVGIATATGAIALYLSPFLGFGKMHPYRCVEALKAEQQVWTLIFNGSIVWIGVFVGTALLSTSLGGAGSVLRSFDPGIEEGSIQRIVLYHSLLVAWVGIASILWMLRPIHRRIYEIARDIDVHEAAQATRRPYLAATSQSPEP